MQRGFNQLSADWQTLKADEEDWRQRAPDAEFVGAWDTHRSVYGYTLRAELVYQLKQALDQAPNFALEPRFKHVLIDEYQDLNPCDLAVAAAIAEQGAALLACGDDDQSIYGFRFADPSGIRDFLDQFSGAANLVLTECRRCGAHILEASRWVARQDLERVEKDLHPAPGQSPGEVRLLSFPSGRAEARGIAQLCQKFIVDGIAPDRILILVRSDHNRVFSTPIKEEFDRLGVSVTTNTEKRSVLEEKPGRRLLSMLRIIVNPRDHLAWRARLQLADGIGESTTRAVYNFAREKGIAYSEALERLPEFSGTIPVNVRGTLERLICDTRDTAARFAVLAAEPDASSGTERPEELMALIEAVARVEVTEDEGLNPVLAYLQEIADSSGAKTLEELLVAIAIGREETDVELEQGSVNMLTMHQAKGLTADVVFVMAAEDQILPRYEDQKSVDDDRRLLYVSMTRAREKLFITYSGRRTGPQQRTGRHPTEPRRTLTRFLRNSPLGVTKGEGFVQANT